MVEREDVVPLRRAWDPASGKGGTRDGGEAGVEKPMPGEAGRKGSELEAAPEVGAGVDATDKVSLMSGSAHDATISRCAVPSRG
jgi:hypothetical protein